MQPGDPRLVVAQVEVEAGAVVEVVLDERRLDLALTASSSPAPEPISVPPDGPLDAVGVGRPALRPVPRRLHVGAPRAIPRVLPAAPARARAAQLKNGLTSLIDVKYEADLILTNIEHASDDAILQRGPHMRETLRDRSVNVRSAADDFRKRRLVFHADYILSLDDNATRVRARQVEAQHEIQ
jgi:hypothetical protein